jgi:hypothetical protein
MTTTIALFQDAAGWERSLYAFLAQKERRSGSRRTVEGYSRMLQHFFGAPDRPSPDADALTLEATMAQPPTPIPSLRAQVPESLDF